jgi:hypothetical protein
MRRTFKTKAFTRWASKAGLTNAALRKAVGEMVQGSIDADLGGGVVKKRVALPGRGKSGGSRTLVATNKGSRWFFVFGFEKNDRDNIDANELAALKKLARDLLKLTDSQLDDATVSCALQEICHDKATHKTKH